MIVIEGRHDVKLLSHVMFAQLMEHNGYSVRGLADDATRVLRKRREKITCGRGTVGNLRSGYRMTCSPKVAEALAECLNVPVAALFSSKVSNVQREVAGKGAA